MTTSSDEPRDSGPELWGGAECTIVRVGEAWRDQSVETGHRFRRDDIDRIAQLGIKRVRFPILWESVAPDSIPTCSIPISRRSSAPMPRASPRVIRGSTIGRR